MFAKLLTRIGQGAFTASIRSAVMRGLRKHPDADLTVAADVIAVTDSILLELAVLSENALDTTRAVLAQGFAEGDAPEDDYNPFTGR